MTLNPAEQLAAAIARAEAAEAARDSAYLAHNLTRQRLDAALQEIERLKEEPVVPFPGLGETATEFQRMATELAELRAYRDITDALLAKMSKAMAATSDLEAARFTMGELWRDWRSDRLGGDSSHDLEGGLGLGRGKEKAHENPTGSAG